MSHHPDKLDSDDFKKEIAFRMREIHPGVPAEVLIRDFDSIYGTLLSICRGDCPISDINLETKETNPQLWTAPPRMDLALTYECNNNCYFCYTGGPRKMTELKTAEWKKVIDKLWK
jgi:lipoate synthase